MNGLIGLGFDLRVDSTATGGLSSNDNLFWNPSGHAPVRYATTSYTSLAAYSAATGQDTRSIQADPRFADPDDGDLRLTYGLPAIDNANSAVANWPATDAAGNPRLDDPDSPNSGLGPVAHADRGALEFVPTVAPPAASVPQLDHVIVVIMENTSSAAARSAPYIGGLVSAYASFSNYYAITHPSQPNYFALWSGDTHGLVSDDCPPPGSPYSGENFGHACEAVGLTWRSYAENLPAPGSSVCAAVSMPNGYLYTRKHSPWVSFANLDHANEKPDEQLTGPLVRPGIDSHRFVNHYTLLRTLCEGLGIPAFGGALAESSITDVWAPPTEDAGHPPATGPGRASVGLGRPNPFRAGTTVTLTLPSPTAVSAEIFDLAGRPVKTLGPATLSGAAEIRWDGSRDDGGPARAGVYLVRVRAGGAVFTRRVVRLQ